MMTTERRRLRLSVRARITGAVAALTALSLLLVGGALYLVESERIDDSVRTSLAQEAAEFRSWVDLAGESGITGPDQIVTGFLERNAPDAHEMLWSFPASGQPQYVGEPDRRLQSSPELTEVVDQLRGTGGVRTISVDGSPYRVAVQPLHDQTSQAAFVVTHDMGATRSEFRSTLATYAALALLALVVITAVSSRLSGRLLQPLHTLKEAAGSISDGDTRTRLEVHGNDDIADLQRTFNAMLDRVESAFAQQRRLLDDAAHELRTPLTILRGHLDVLDVNDVHDVRATRELLTDEIDRMARLVNELLELARSARPDFIRPAEVSLRELTTGALERARGLAERTWQADDIADGVLWADHQRITQALVQLADNAVKHTTAGDTIGFGAVIAGRTAEIWVRDTGSGIDPGVADTLFDRFARAPGDSTGFGLGLSIVQAIAQAHGGRVRLDPVPVGARFTLVLPLMVADTSPEAER